MTDTWKAKSLYTEKSQTALQVLKVEKKITIKNKSFKMNSQQKWTFYSIRITIK